MKVRLLVNMVVEGKLIQAGTEIDKEKLPERFRKDMYIEAIGYPHTQIPLPPIPIPPYC